MYPPINIRKPEVFQCFCVVLKETSDIKWVINPLGAKPTKWPNALNCLSVFDHFVGLGLKGLTGFNKEGNVLDTLKIDK